MDIQAGKIKIGPYGRYYEYIDENGATKRISMKDNYLSEDLMYKLVQGQKVQFTKLAVKGEKIIEATLMPWTSKSGKETTIIHTEVIKYNDDSVTITANKEKFIMDPLGNIDQYRDYCKSVLRSLHLIRDWNVYVEVIPGDDKYKPVEYMPEKMKENKYSRVTVYRDYTYNGEDKKTIACQYLAKYTKDGHFMKELTQPEYEPIRTEFLDEYAKARKIVEEKIQNCNNVRNELYNAYVKDGLESVVKDVNLDDTLNLGHFQRLKTFLVRIKTKENAVTRIIREAYTDVLDDVILKQDLLYMLKVYYEFNNISEKNVKSLAKFIAKHKIEEYYDDILKYDEAIESIIDNSTDRGLLKRVLTNIAGNESKVNFLKDKSFYFEKTVRVKEGIILYNPVLLLDELKNLIGIYNINSQAAILTNIILNPDYSFTYQFYTYSQTEDGSDMDGRRISYMTKLYNRCHETKLYFDYDDITVNDEEN